MSNPTCTTSPGIPRCKFYNVLLLWCCGVVVVVVWCCCGGVVLLCCCCVVLLLCWCAGVLVCWCAGVLLLCLCCCVVVLWCGGVVVLLCCYILRSTAQAQVLHTNTSSHRLTYSSPSALLPLLPLLPLLALFSHLACEQGRTSAVVKLIALGANTNVAVPSTRMTPLHLAASTMHGMDSLRALVNAKVS
jgi:hypothetical protein